MKITKNPNYESLPKEFKDRILFLEEKVREYEHTISRFSDSGNWDCRKEYGPYGIYYEYVWVDKDDPQTLAQQTLEEFEEEDNTSW